MVLLGVRGGAVTTPLQLPFPLSISPFYLSKGFEISTSRVDQLVKNLPVMQETPVLFWVRKFPWRRDKLPNPVFLGFLCGSAGKESTCNAGDLSSILGLGRSPGEGKGYPLQYSGLENSMDCIVLGFARVGHT